MKTLRSFISLVVFILLFPLVSSATNLGAFWDPNKETDIAKYVISYGLIHGNYTTTIQLGNVTNYTISNPTPGKTYYVVVKAIDTSNNESVYSDEATIYIPIEGITLNSPLNGQILSTRPTFTWTGEGFKTFSVYLSLNSGSFQRIYAGSSKSYTMNIALWYWFIAPKTIMRWYVVGTTSDNQTINSPTLTFSKK